MSPRLVPALAWLAAAASCAFLLSCQARGGSLSLEADEALRPRLETLVAEQPLPEGWKTGDTGAEASGCLVLSLAYLPPGTEPSANARRVGLRFLAASVDLADEEFSVSPEAAQSLGLEPLESIGLPRRALAVNGIWPGRRGYPFRQTLALRAKSPRSEALPRAIEKWLDAAATRYAHSATASGDTPLILSASGDIQVGEAQWPLLSGSESALNSLLGEGLLDLIRGADVAVANLEAPITARGYPNPLKRYQFRLPPGSTAAFKKAGFDLLLFANNHGFDYGAEGFEDSLDDFQGSGLPLVGAGRDKTRAQAARFLETGGGSLAFLGLAFYPSERQGFTLADAAAHPDRAGIAVDEEATLAAVKSARESGKTVVVLAHGGSEYVEEPNPEARALYARLADAGAALVAGSHPHLLQGCEARSGALIAYSLGNFLFTGETEPPEAWKSAVLEFLLYRGRVRGLRIHPITAGYDFTRLDPDQAGAEKRFSRLCAGLALEN